MHAAPFRCGTAVRLDALAGAARVGLTIKPIRAAMQRRGYFAKDHNEGWRLLQAACGHIMDEDGPEQLTDEVAEAIKELDAWDESGFRIARAALRRLHPEQETYLFKNLQASKGLDAVVGVMTFLDRLDALENDPDRKATRKEDRAALDTLATRGIDRAERDRLRKLVKIVKSSPDVALEDGEESDKKEEARQKALVALRTWYEDWSNTARAVVRRRDHLIRLGLAKRKANGAVVDVGDDEGDDDGSNDPPETPAKPSKKEPTS